MISMDKIPAYLDTLLWQWGKSGSENIGFASRSAVCGEYTAPGFPEIAIDNSTDVERLGRLIPELGHQGLIDAVTARYRRRLNKRKSAFYCGCTRSQYLDFLDFAIGKLDRRFLDSE